MAVSAPYARVSGKIIEPRSGEDTSRVSIIFDPDPYTPAASDPNKGSVSQNPVYCWIDKSGNLVGPTGEAFVDLIGFGSGVSPSGAWTYSVTVIRPGRSSVFHTALSAGVEYDAATLTHVASNAGPFLPAAGGGDAGGGDAGGNVDLKGYMTRAESVSAFQPKGNYATSDQLKAIQLTPGPKGDAGPGFLVLQLGATIPEGTPSGTLIARL